MKNLIIFILSIFRNLYRPFSFIVSYSYFVKQFIQFQNIKKDSESELPMKWQERYPILNERTSTTYFEPHYTFHPAWAARILKIIDPKQHIDISSSLQFITLVSAFIPIEFYDYRPVDIDLSGLHCGKSDLTNLPFEAGSIESLSCMHVVEHIGLGRYGDKLDPDGDLKAIKELKRVLAPGGNLLFVVPVGQARVQFNAHRIYDPVDLLEKFKGWELMDFSLVDDQGRFWFKTSISQAKDLYYGCGCFWLRKPDCK